MPAIPKIDSTIESAYGDSFGTPNLYTDDVDHNREVSQTDRFAATLCFTMIGIGTAFGGAQCKWDCNQKGAALSSVTEPLTQVANFGAAITGIRQLNRRDHYQDSFLLCGLVFGVAIGMAITQDLHSTIINILPWSIMSSLISSIIIHCVHRKRRSSSIN